MADNPPRPAPGFTGDAGQEFAGFTRTLQDQRASGLLDALHQARDALERTRTELAIVLQAHASRPIFDGQDQATAADITTRLTATLRGVSVWLDSTGQVAFTSTSPI